MPPLKTYIFKHKNIDAELTVRTHGDEDRAKQMLAILVKYDSPLS